MLRRLARFSAVLVAVLALAGITFAGATLAAGSTFKNTTTVAVSPQVQLATSSFGSGADVTVTYSCFPGFGGKGGYPGGGGFASVSLTDLNGNQGFAGFSPTCNDTKQSAAVFVQGFLGPFAAGSGAASAFICGFDCNSASREVKIS
jgi:hypothetical protein